MSRSIYTSSKPVEVEAPELIERIRNVGFRGEPSDEVVVKVIEDRNRTKIVVTRFGKEFVLFEDFVTNFIDRDAFIAAALKATREKAPKILTYLG